MIDKNRDGWDEIKEKCDLCNELENISDIQSLLGRKLCNSCRVKLNKIKNNWSTQRVIQWLERD